MGDTPEKEKSSRSQPADRRDFLRQIAKDGVKSASSLLGVVGAIRREAGELADDLRIEDPLADLVDDAPQPQRRAAEAALDAGGGLRPESRALGSELVRGWLTRVASAEPAGAA